MTRATLFACLLAFAGCHSEGGHEAHATGAEHAHAQAATEADPAHAHAAPEGDPAHAAPTVDDANANPVQIEMRLLTATMQQAVDGIGRGDVREIAHSLHRLHAAKERTSASIAEGSYHPPREGADMARFTELDEAFHGKLIPLVRASQANDVPAAAEAFGAVMAGCNGCHSEFR